MNIVVIGTGSMGKNHARVCSALGVLAGVFDADENSAKRVASSYGCRSYGTVDEIMNDKDIDGVIIATPTSHHYDIASKAMLSGKHVLLEKPVCASEDEAKRLIRLAKDAGIVFEVGQIERYNPVVRFARESLASGKFGELLTVATRRVSNFPGRIRDVGCILDIGIHDIDAIRYVVGSEVKSVHASAGRHKADGVEDHANIMLGFENGKTGVLEVNWMTPMRVRKMFLTCSGAFVELDYMNQAARISSSAYLDTENKSAYMPQVEYQNQDIMLKKQEPLMNEIEDFIGAIKEKRKPLVTGEDGLAALRIANAAVESYKTGKIIEL